MILDVLLQAQESEIDDLSFRYGCRARNCGVCTVDVNGKQEYNFMEKNYDQLCDKLTDIMIRETL